MNWKTYCDLREPIVGKLRQLKSELDKLDKEYINYNAEFKKGDHVVIDTHKKKIHAVVAGNKIGFNGRCIPILSLVRKNRTSRSAYFRLHEFDKSIVIEKCDEP